MAGIRIINPTAEELVLAGTASPHHSLFRSRCILKKFKIGETHQAETEDRLRKCKKNVATKCLLFRMSLSEEAGLRRAVILLKTYLAYGLCRGSNLSDEAEKGLHHKWSSQTSSAGFDTFWTATHGLGFPTFLDLSYSGECDRSRNANTRTSLAWCWHTS